jgi:hypothetical protein
MRRGGSAIQWSVGADNNSLSVSPHNKNNANFDPEIYSTLSTDGIIDNNGMWDRFQKTFGGMKYYLT